MHLHELDGLQESEVEDGIMSVAMRMMMIIMMEKIVGSRSLWMNDDGNYFHI